MSEGQEPTLTHDHPHSTIESIRRCLIGQYGESRMTKLPFPPAAAKCDIVAKRFEFHRCGSASKSKRLAPTCESSSPTGQRQPTGAQVVLPHEPNTFPGAIECR
jgi:hypothetical protein